MANNETSVLVTLLISKQFVPQENKTIVTVYCPELDLGGVGISKEEAEKQFREALKMNVATAKAGKFLKNVLLNFGWTEKGGHWSPLEFQIEKTTVTL